MATDIDIDSDSDTTSDDCLTAAWGTVHVYYPPAAGLCVVVSDTSGYSLWASSHSVTFWPMDVDNRPRWWCTPEVEDLSPGTLPHIARVVLARRHIFARLSPTLRAEVVQALQHLSPTNLHPRHVRRALADVPQHVQRMLRRTANAVVDGRASLPLVGEVACLVRALFGLWVPPPQRRLRPVDVRRRVVTR